MKVFYGGIFIDKEALQKAGIEHPIKLEYYKMINEDEIVKHNKEIYGIYVIKTEYRKNDIFTEEKEMKHLSNDELEINRILNLFKEFAVTPIAAEDVAEDLLKQSKFFI